MVHKRTRTKRRKQTKRHLKSRRHHKQPPIRKQSGGGLFTSNPVSDTFMNAYRYIPHYLQSSYNGILGVAQPTSFLPWVGHYK